VNILKLVVNLIIKNIQIKKIAGAGFPVTKVHPAQCKNATAGHIGPFFSSSSSKATPSS
jgi:hypothetical protein